MVNSHKLRQRQGWIVLALLVLLFHCDTTEISA